MTTTIPSVRGETAPKRYDGLGRQFIGGVWRDGNGERTLEDRDPWSGDLLLESLAAAVTGKVMHQGQICMATNRILIDRAIYDTFVERFTAVAIRT